MLGLALLLLAADPKPAGDPDDGFLAQARVFALGQEFEKCLKRLEQANRKGVSNQRLADIDLYQGLCQFGLGNEKGALSSWELALRLDPKAKLPPMQSPKVKELFEKLREQVPKEPEEPPKDELKEVKPDRPEAGSCRASTDCSALELCVNNRCVPPPPQVPATVPEKHFAAPVTIGIVGVLAAGAGVTFGLLAKDAESRSKSGSTLFGDDATRLANQATTDALVANICYGVAAVAIVVALIVYLVTN